MTTRNDAVRIGVIGAGFIGTTVGRGFVADPRSTVVALADVNEASRREGGDTLLVPPEAQYPDYREMLDRESLDAVLVGTPHTLHYEQVMDALDRGLHVLCDKPLTTDLGRAKDIVRRVEASDGVLMVGYQRHLNPAFQHARERWQGTDRTPTFVTAEITQNWISRFRDTWRTDPELSGGGNLYDTGSHLLDAVLWTTGLTPTAVSADMTFADADRRVDEQAILTVRFAEGATANVSVFSDAPCVREHIHVWDTEGAVYLDGREWEQRDLSVVEADSTTVTPYFDYRDQRTKAEAFVECVRRGDRPPATARDGLRVTAVTEAAYESARTGQKVAVDLSLD